jgi:chorismate mutase
MSTRRFHAATQGPLIWASFRRLTSRSSGPVIDPTQSIVVSSASFTERERSSHRVWPLSSESLGGEVDPAERSEEMQEELNELRSQIDRIDQELVALLARRFRITGSVGALKARSRIASSTPARENEVLERVEALASESGVPAGLTTSIFKEIIAQVVRDHDRIRTTRGEPDG